MIFYVVVLVQENMLRENVNTATSREQMVTNTGTEHSVSSDTPSISSYNSLEIYIFRSL